MQPPGAAAQGRAPGRLGLLLAAAGLLVVAAVAVAVDRRSATRIDLFEQGAAAAAGLAAVGIALSVRPAWPLAVGICLGAFSGHWDVMGVPVALDRLLIGTAIVSVLVRERLRSRDGLRTRPIDWLLAVVAVYVVASSALAGTLGDHDARYALLDRLSIVGFVLFFVAPKAFRTARDRQVLLGCLVTLGGYLGLTALLETTGPEALVVPDYISDPSVGTHADRARGPFAEAAANGLALYGCAIAAVIAACTWRERRWRWAAAIVVGLCALGILLTVTRAAWIAAAAGTVVVLFAARETRRFALPAILVAGAGVLLAFAIVPGLGDRAQERADDRPPLWDRQNSNAAALRMLEERPLLGFGWGRFASDSGEFYRLDRDIPMTGVRNLHNVYLSNAVELGLVGAALWLAVAATALLGAVVRRGPPELRVWKLGLLALLVCSAVSALSTPLGFALPTLLLWTWAGLARGG